MSRAAAEAAARSLGSSLDPTACIRLTSSSGGRASRKKRRALPRVGEPTEKSGPVRTIPIPPKEAA